MLVWNTELWLIDHGASLYFHYSPENWELKAENPFPASEESCVASLRGSAGRNG